MSRRFDTEAEAVEFAGGLTKDPPEWLGWVKAFRSDNEGYVAFRWWRPPAVNIEADTAKATEQLVRIQSGFRPPPRQLFFSLLIAGLTLAVALVIFVNLLIYL